MTHLDSIRIAGSSTYFDLCTDHFVVSQLVKGLLSRLCFLSPTLRSLDHTLPGKIYTLELRVRLVESRSRARERLHSPRPSEIRAPIPHDGLCGVRVRLVEYRSRTRERTHSPRPSEIRAPDHPRRTVWGSGSVSRV